MASWHEARRKRDDELAKRREAERVDAYDFRVDGDEEHAPHCVHALAGGQPCSRTYDPKPYREAAPDETRLYEGTGIGLLYGLPGCERHAYQLAGWNVAPGSNRP